MGKGNAAWKRTQDEIQTATFISNIFSYKSYELLAENDQKKEKHTQVESEKVKTDEQRNGNNAV